MQVLFPYNLKIDPDSGPNARGGVPLKWSDLVNRKKPSKVENRSEEETIHFMKSDVATFRKHLAETLDNTQKTIDLHAIDIR